MSQLASFFAGEGFNAAQIAPVGSGGNLPFEPNGLMVAITEHEEKQTATGGVMLVLTLTVTHGEHQGKSGNMRLNLINDSEKAVMFAKRQLSSICHACGQLQLRDPTQLYNKTFIVTTKYQDTDEAQEKGHTEIARILNQDGSSIRMGQPVVQNAVTTPASQVVNTQAAPPVEVTPTPDVVSPPQTTAESGMPAFMQ